MVKRRTQNLPEEALALKRIPATPAGLRAFRARELLSLREIAPFYGANLTVVSAILRGRRHASERAMLRLRAAFASALAERKAGRRPSRTRGERK